MPAVEVKENLFWVGAVDWNLRDFHGYALARWGTTYNAFLLKDEKTVLFDTVSSAFCEEFFDNIGQVVDPSQIDYLVVNHVEPDHSGCLVETVHRIKPEKILCSPMGKTFMISHYHRPDWPFEVLKTGDTVSFGRKTARFIELKMLHWPDNMGCYLPEDRLFISSDAFGHNWATSERFDDEVDFGEIRRHMAHYFANIILPFSGNVIKTLEQIESFGWEIETIAPDHGLILRKHPREAIAAYAEWAAQRASYPKGSPSRSLT
jgi:flavorubredoxin